MGGIMSQTVVEPLSVHNVTISPNCTRNCGDNNLVRCYPCQHYMKTGIIMPACKCSNAEGLCEVCKQIEPSLSPFPPKKLYSDVVKFTSVT